MTEDPKRPWEITKAMQRHNIRTIYDFTEFDQWVNDATRKDINNLVKENNGKVIGVKVWEFEIKRGRELVDTLNFGVSYIFRASDENKVAQLINSEKARSCVNDEWELGSGKKCMAFLDEMDKLAIYQAMWV